ncbi:MAG: lipopolysaccharide heptosyltransferase [Pseudomonadota bacterium]|jgi:heptosyltransferase I
MRVLIIKMSSMGDIIHTLPAVTDATKAISNIQFDWVVEEAFTEIPKWHNQVYQVIPIALRRWRKAICRTIQNGELKQFYTQLRAQEYDFVLDAQGSIKSAITSYLSRGYRLGMDKHSVRESLAYLAYQQTFSVSWQQHAINRLRQLFAEALKYSLPETKPDYGINKERLIQTKITLPGKYLVCIPNSSCVTKLWSNQAWSLLIEKMTALGISIFIPWGNENERKNANRLSNKNPLTHVLPYLSLNQMAAVLLNAQAVVAVDTGLSHLSAALGVPTIVLYGPTNPSLIGTIGPSQLHIKFPVNEKDMQDSNARILRKITTHLRHILKV